MSYKITIASGKGGTGKTSVAVNLYHFLAKEVTGNIQMLDCDVEEPNDLLFFPNYTKGLQETIHQMIPEINEDQCTYCRKCSDYCEFNALTIIPPVKFIQVNDVLCHSCGACSVACTEEAIKEVEHSIGNVTHYDLGLGKGLLEGKLQIGSAMQTMLIKELKNRADESSDIILYDAPPGTSCSVVQSVADADFVVLVTEPTPFGLHDLKLTIELMKDLNKEFGVVINKSGLGSNETQDYLLQNNIELLGEIPFKREFAALYAEGLLGECLPMDLKTDFIKIVDILSQKIYVDEGNYHS